MVLIFKFPNFSIERNEQNYTHCTLSQMFGRLNVLGMTRAKTPDNEERKD